MALPEQGDSDRVETRAVIHAASGEPPVALRRSIEGIWLKPASLDGDGEHHLVLEDLGRALRVLGFNCADLFPDG